MGEIDIKKFLGDTLAEEEKKARENLQSDKGHVALVNDLSEIFNEACECQFHDMLNTNYAAPKLTLVYKLNDIINNTREGKYDN